MTDDLIEQAARALCDHECDPGWWDATDDEEREHYRRTIRAVLPLVDAHGRACAATALRQAADAVTAWGRDGIRNAVRELRDRADALEADR